MAEMADATSSSASSSSAPSPSKPMDLQGPLNSHPPDNDAKPSLSPALTRHNTATSTTLSDKTLTCRICRSEATPEQPLYHPCKCSGSIKHVHQDCLMQWLAHSHKKHCELCKTPFRFTKLYSAHMPSTLPWGVFIRQGAWDAVHGLLWLGRVLVVMSVWCVLLPWVVRRAWRWMFWLADAGWAREAFVAKVLGRMGVGKLEEQLGQGNTTGEQGYAAAVNETHSGEPLVYNVARQLLHDFGFATLTTSASNNTASTVLPIANSYAQSDKSILSSWTYLSALTSNPILNRAILDVFEGQLITCVVIAGFILVFLIREWVVQQQPLFNALAAEANNLRNDVNEANEELRQLREAAEGAREESERLSRQAASLEQARQRLAELQREAELAGLSLRYADEAGVGSVVADERKIAWQGWENLAQLMDSATSELHVGFASPPPSTTPTTDVDALSPESATTTSSNTTFKSRAADATIQIRAAGLAGVDLENLADNIFAKLASCSEFERQAWRAILMFEIEKARLVHLVRPTPLELLESQGREPTPDRDQEESGSTLAQPLRSRAKSDPRFARPTKRLYEPTLSRARQADVSGRAKKIAAADTTPLELNGELGAALNGNLRLSRERPPMPERDFSSRATHIQRLLEEAEGVFGSQEGIEPPEHVATSAVPHELDAAPTVTAEGAADDVRAQDHDRIAAEAPGDVDDGVGKEDEELPITNAGPDARVNITRVGQWKGKKATIIVPPPLPLSAGIGAGKVVSDEELRQRLEEDRALERLEAEIRDEDLAVRKARWANEVPASVGGVQPQRPTNENPFHPDGPDPEPRSEEPITAQVRLHLSAALEDSVDDKGDDQASEEASGHDGADSQARPVADPHPAGLNRLLDWFWGDIQLPAAQQPQPLTLPANEEQLLDDEQPQTNLAAFAPIHTPDPPAEPEQPLPLHHHHHHHQHHDPEVLHAAQQAGLDPAHLDAEAVEEAEDLEGILELVGLQGPLIGLLQTSMFCLVLITGTVFGAVGLPYVWGKLVLSFLGAPAWFAIKMPLTVASFAADLVVDVAMLGSSWMVYFACKGVDVSLAALETRMPAFTDVRVADWVTQFAFKLALNSGTRLQSLFVSTEPTVAHELGLGVNWQFLGASIHAHASLREMQGQTSAVLSAAAALITDVVNTVSSGNVMQKSGRLLGSLATVPQFAKQLALIPLINEHLTQPLLRIFNDLRSGAVIIQPPTAILDPSLVYWSSTDRALAVLAGYIALALLAAVYVAIDTPLTRTHAGQKTEKLVRDSLRQAGGVLKVILIISIEMLVFPLYCGLLLDLAFLPLFSNANVATRWQFARSGPYLFSFVHWFVGTCYMFHFALFVGMCRKILRKGVLWFIRDPDDPTFHPVRDVLERSVTVQLRKIAFSALVYGGLVILCLGGVIWSIGRCFGGLFPVVWFGTEPVLEFPLDMLMYQLLTPLVVRVLKPSEAVNILFGWWLRRCARVLRLSYFLFDERRPDEEGRYLRRSWLRLLAFVDYSPATENNALTGPSAHFVPDGRFVLTPCNDQYRPPKLGEAFLHVDEQDVYVADASGMRNDHFAKVYVPPHFRLRVSLFMVCLWIFSAFSGLCATLVPLVFGRALFALFMPEGVRVNDIYAYSAGAYILGGLLYAVFKGGRAVAYLKSKLPGVDVKAAVGVAKMAGVKTLKCAYLYTFIFVVLPTICALLLHFYLILPLHIWVTLLAAPDSTSTPGNSTIFAVAANSTSDPMLIPPKLQHPSLLAAHTIHILQSYCLGVLYLRLAARMILSSPTSRAAEAWRRITAHGHLNPDIRLANRYLILPATLLSASALLLPPLAAGLIILYPLSVVSGDAGDALVKEVRIWIYRESYPAAACVVMMALLSMQLSNATARWRARIRDEVYLVGERLHNFGEKRPPPPPASSDGMVEVYKL